MDEKTKSPRNQPGLRDLEYHARKCKICHHPDRLGIEEDFIHWRCPDDIAADYKLNPRSVYRHAHATGLFKQRRRNLRCVYETFLERAEYVRCSASEIIRVARVYASISDDGEWIEPPSTRNLRVTKVSDPTAVVIPIDSPDPAKPVLPTVLPSIAQRSESGDNQEPVPPAASSEMAEAWAQTTPIPESPAPVSLAFAIPEGVENRIQADTQCQTELNVTNLE